MPSDVVKESVAFSHDEHSLVLAVAALCGMTAKDWISKTAVSMAQNSAEFATPASGAIKFVPTFMEPKEKSSGGKPTALKKAAPKPEDDF